VTSFENGGSVLPTMDNGIRYILEENGQLRFEFETQLLFRFPA
jgi:hypothetical protein